MLTPGSPQADLPSQALKPEPLKPPPSGTARPTLKLPVFKAPHRSAPLLTHAQVPSQQGLYVRPDPIQPHTAPYRAPEALKGSSAGSPASPDGGAGSAAAADVPGTAGKGPSLASLLLHQGPRVEPDAPDPAQPSSPVTGASSSA